MKYVLCLLLIVALVASAAGCGNVNVSGQAATALEASALDAYQAYIRAAKPAAAPPATRPADEPIAPLWMQAYLGENYLQWRWFVRANRRDLTWGPKLPGEE